MLAMIWGGTAIGTLGVGLLAPHQTNPCNPFIDKPGILARAQMPIMINPAGKYIFVHQAASPLKPSQQAGPRVWEQLELNRPTCFLLHHDRTRSNLSAAYNVSDLHLHEVAATEFTIDRKVEKCTITQAAALIEVESDLPYSLRF